MLQNKIDDCSVLNNYKFDFGQETWVLLADKEYFANMASKHNFNDNKLEEILIGYVCICTQFMAQIQILKLNRAIFIFGI